LKEIGERVKPFVPNVTESELAQRLGKKVTETEESLLEGTNVYRYGGYKDRAARERSKLRQSVSNEEASAPNEPTASVQEDPEAGESVVLHKTSKLTQMWEDFKENSGVLRKIHGLKQRYDESNNVFVFFMREFTGGITGRLSSLFSETETAKALKEISLRDPKFSQEQFMKEAHEYLIPEILDAILAGDLPTLRTWASEATFNLLKATFEAQLKAGQRMEGRVVDLRHIELVTAKMLDDTPVLVLTFTTQQISYVRDANGVIVEGREDAIENVNYVMALAKEEASQPQSPTKGWRLLEIAIRPGGGW
jgi:import inner membrane translocase subunit TIM44